MRPEAGPEAEAGRGGTRDAPVPEPVATVLRVLAETRGALACGCAKAQRLLSGESVGAAARAGTVESKDIVEAARQHLESLMPEHGPHVNMELLTKVASIRVPAGRGPVTLRASLSHSRPHAGNVQVDVEVMQGAALLKRVSVGFLVMHCGTRREMRAC
jgi:hypothetical protein